MEQISALRLTAEEESNVQLLEITDGIVIGVTNSAYLTGSLILPDTITEIAHHAFESCSGLTRIVIPDSVTKIGDWLFRDCTDLKEVIIGSGISKIGIGAFFDCTHLSTITIPQGITETGNNAFCNIRSDAQFTVASNAVKKLLKHSDSSIQDEHIIVKRLSSEVLTP